jgi:hypothetical protein
MTSEPNRNAIASRAQVGRRPSVGGVPSHEPAPPVRRGSRPYRRSTRVCMAPYCGTRRSHGKPTGLCTDKALIAMTVTSIARAR